LPIQPTLIRPTPSSVVPLSVRCPTMAVSLSFRRVRGRRDYC
jgi:hypothetical protein